MDKQSFLNELEMYLKSELNRDAVEYHIGYYRDYIEEQIRQGYPEHEVLATLGNPRIIGKTIVSASEMEDNREKETYGGFSYNTDSYGQETGSAKPQRGLTGKLKVYAVLAAVVCLIFIVISIVAKIVSFFLPVIIIILLISIFMKGSGKRP